MATDWIGVDASAAGDVTESPLGKSVNAAQKEPRAYWEKAKVMA